MLQPQQDLQGKILLGDVETVCPGGLSSAFAVRDQRS